VLWEDNYITLLPGEKRQVRASYRTQPWQGRKPVVEATGLNVE
jgi:exo-1,4-beta-D-glucosaminidase